MLLPDKYRSLRVVVIGSYNTDLVIWCEAIPVRGETMLGGEFEMFTGGRGANCAVAAARAGCRVKFVGAHGPDAFGKMARDRLTKEGIEITDFIELPFARTGVAMFFKERTTAAHAALVAISANNQFSPTLVQKIEDEIEHSDLVFTQFEIAPAVLLEIYRLCSRHRKRLVLHAAPVQPPMQLPTGDYYLVIADDFESLLLTGCNDVPAAIQELHRRGVQNVIIKQKDRSLLFSDGTISRAQTIPLEPLIQVAGSVECLTAWAGVTLACTGDLAYATYVGVQALAVSRARHGTQDSMPYPSELLVNWRQI
jgi:ribokinase